MPRRPDPTRKPELLGQIIDFLLDKSLAATSLRTLADGLGVSTYSLVYHFGSRADLVREIVLAIESRQQELLEVVTFDTSSVEKYLLAFGRAWDWALSPRNRQLQRLEFEAAMLEALDEGGPTSVRQAFEAWNQVALDALTDFGIPLEVARTEGRIMVDTMFGLQFDLILTGEVERVDGVFRAALEAYRRRIEELVATHA